MEERRHTLRHRTYKGAHIASRGRSTIACIVRNLSDGGACLIIDNPVGLPETFHLVFDDGESDRQCRVVWRGRDRLGVRFV